MARNFVREFRSEAEVIIVAASRDQADILRRQAEQLVKRSGVPVGKFGWQIGDDVFEVKSGYREIRYGEARMRVLAADAATGDGTIPTLALVDELHRHRSLDLYGVLADALDAPAPAGRRGSLAEFAEFCGSLILDSGEAMVLEAHERKILRAYFSGVRETVVIIGKKNGKTTLLGALALFHLKHGAPSRQMITISTAGESEEDNPLGLVRKRAHKLDSFKRRGCVNTAQAPDKSFAWLEWCLDPDDDPMDFRRVKQANPASWFTVSSLKRAHKAPSMTPGRWARFRCGIWTSGEIPWVSKRQWSDLAVDIGGLVEGERVSAAVVYGENPAIALAAPRDTETVEDESGAVELTGAAVRVWLYDGRKPQSQIERELLELAEAYDIVSVSYDEAEFLRSAEILTDRGLEMERFPHSPRRLAIVSQTLNRLIQAGLLRHDGSEDLAYQVQNAITQDKESGWRLVKSQGTRGVIAMAVAVHHATQITPEPPKPLIVVAG